MSDYIEFDCCPINEDCVQVSKTDDYMPAMRAQAKRYVEMLEKRFPNVPGFFCIGRCEHDFGTYLEVRYRHDDDNEGYASSNFVESHLPFEWSDSEVFEWHWAESEPDDE